MDWKECLSKRIAKKVNLDENLINSLIKTSENKLKSSDKLDIDNITANSKFILAYDSLREILEALALKNGFKIYNHEGHTAFLKEILKKSDDGDEFDEIRKVRNDVNYYGKDINMQEAEDIIKRVKSLRKKLLERFEK